MISILVAEADHLPFAAGLVDDYQVALVFSLQLGISIEQLDPVNGPVRRHINVELITDTNRLDLRGLLVQSDIGDVVAWIIAELHSDLPPLKIPYNNRNDKPSAALFDGEGFHLLIGIALPLPQTVKGKIPSEPRTTIILRENVPHAQRSRQLLLQWLLVPASDSWRADEIEYASAIYSVSKGLCPGDPGKDALGAEAW